MPISTKTLQKYLNDYFVETGGAAGKGIKAALAAGFKNIISIELNPKMVIKLKEMFKNYPNVTIVEGDSSHILGDCIKDIDTHITFWLDAHSAIPYEVPFQAPILRELTQIETHVKHVPIILIDDRRLFESHFNLTEEVVKRKLIAVWQNFEIRHEDGGGGNIPEYRNDILVADPR